MHTDLSKVSIIIPTYNNGQVLEQAVLSVIQQTYPHVELIVIDGGSKDHTLSLIKKYESYIAYWVSEPDRGVYDAMNKGIRAATGEWLYFMGSDDQLYDAEVLGKVFTRTLPADCQVIYGNVLSTRFDGVYAGEFNDEKIIKQNICHQAMFTNRQLFTQLGDFDAKFRSHADWDFNLRWFFNRSIVRLYVECIVARYADGGISSTVGDTRFAEEKMERILLYGRKHLPKPLLEGVYSALFFQYLKKMKFFKSVVYTFNHAFWLDGRIFFAKSIAKATLKKIL